MGFFSWECKVCGHPLLSYYATNHINAWMEDAIAVLPNKVVVGTYDGYGRVAGVPILDFGNEPDCYHAACWIRAGRPKDYLGGSASAADQGYFFDEGAHDLPEPRDTQWEAT